MIGKRIKLQHEFYFITGYTDTGVRAIWERTGECVDLTLRYVA